MVGLHAGKKSSFKPPDMWAPMPEANVILSRIVIYAHKLLLKHAKLLIPCRITNFLRFLYALGYC